jgi:restriction system protein
VNKDKAMLVLARRRQADVIEGYGNIGDYHGGRYEVDYVSPWTRSASNFDADVMIVAQDWASHDYLSAPYRPYLVELGYDPALVTNRNLHRLLERHLAITFNATFATNVFPFVKAGGMSASIGSRPLLYSCEEYLVPQIAIVEPRLVICLGKAAYGSLRAVAGLNRVGGLDDMIASPFKIGRSAIVGVAHTGQLGTNGRGVARVDQDWRALAKYLK